MNDLEKNYGVFDINSKELIISGLLLALVLVLFFLGTKGSIISGVPETNIGYSTSEVSITGRCSWSGTLSNYAVAINDVPNYIEVDNQNSYIRATIVSVDNSVNNMWVGSSGRGSFRAEVHSSAREGYKTVWLGGFGEASHIALQRESSIDGNCRIDYNIVYISTLEPTPTQVVIQPSLPEQPTPTPTPIWEQPLPTPTAIPSSGLSTGDVQILGILAVSAVFLFIILILLFKVKR